MHDELQEESQELSSNPGKATHEQGTVNTPTDLTAGGGGEARQARQVLQARQYSTVFVPQPLNKDQFYIQEGY